ncbi:hypothetical protein BaRGS_00037928, partial [Batillaria attramentaria]
MQPLISDITQMLCGSRDPGRELTCVIIQTDGKEERVKTKVKKVQCMKAKPPHCLPDVPPPRSQLGVGGEPTISEEPRGVYRVFMFGILRFYMTEYRPASCKDHTILRYDLRRFKAW